MFLRPSAQFARNQTETARVCIIGTGPAGITLAMRLAAAGEDVLLLEAGGEYFDAEGQDLFEGEVRGDPYFTLADARLRMLGGSSGHWGGICRPMPYAVLDTEPPWPVTGWPIRSTDLRPYETEASEIVEVPGNFTDTDLGGGLFRLDFQESPPVRFGDKYFEALTQDPNIRVALNSAAVDVEIEEGQITALQVVSNLTHPWRVEADYFVLCAGGIENSRLLRYFNDRHDHALVTNHDLIGRYWMEHLNSEPAQAILMSGGEAYTAAHRGERLYFGTDPFDAPGHGHGRVNFEFVRASWNQSRLNHIMCVAPRLGNRLALMAERNLICEGLLEARSDQPPAMENRITLASETDALGLPRPVLNWTRSALDRRIVEEATHRIATAFAESDMGRVMLMHWLRRDHRPFPPEVRSGDWHHMGGTRMSVLPQDGIVTPDLRVHEMQNLYIGGSSVFPVGGDVNPTYTIVQLSLRLADHLIMRMS